jgi:hypothetical protein
MSLFRSDRGRRRPHRSAPMLETLEGRQLLTIAFSYDPATAVLTLTGDGGANVVTIDDDGTDNANSVTVVGDGSAFVPSGPVREIRFDAQGGNDRLTYNLNGDLGASIKRRIVSDLGAGRDRFAANLNGDLLGESALEINARGGTGNDNVRVNANDDVDVRPDARLALTFRGDAGADDMRTNLRGEVDGSILIDQDGGTGNDRVDVNLTLDAGSSGRVGDVGLPAVVLGGTGRDRLRFAVFTDPNDAQVVRVDGTVDGGAGNDRCNRTSNIASVNCEADFILS